MKTTFSFIVFYALCLITLPNCELVVLNFYSTTLAHKLWEIKCVSLVKYHLIWNQANQDLIAEMELQQCLGSQRPQKTDFFFVGLFRSLCSGCRQGCMHREFCDHFLSSFFIPFCFYGWVSSNQFAYCTPCWLDFHFILRHSWEKWKKSNHLTESKLKWDEKIPCTMIYSLQWSNIISLSLAKMIYGKDK